jgi:hypothetical protein
MRYGIAGKAWESDKDILNINQSIARKEKGLCEKRIDLRNAENFARGRTRIRRKDGRHSRSQG